MSLLVELPASAPVTTGTEVGARVGDQPETSASGIPAAVASHLGLGSRWLGALFAGYLMAAASPPSGSSFSGLMGLALIAVLVRDQSPIAAFVLAGQAGGLTFFLACLWWPSTLHRFAGVDGALAWAVAIAFAVYQALPLALAVGLARWIERRFEVRPLVSAPLLLGLCEGLLPFSFQAHLAILATGWPLVLQVAELGGAPAVSTLLLALAWVGPDLVRSWGDRAASRHALGTLLVLLVLLGFGALRIHQVDTARLRAPELRVGLVQPNFGTVTIEDRQKWGHRMIADLRKATARLDRSGVDLIVLPEASWPFLVDAELAKEYPRPHPWHLARSDDTRLLFGALSHPFAGSTIWNSAFLVGKDGTIAGRYDKTRLVPLAEGYAPRLMAFASAVGAELPERPVISPGRQPALLTDGELRLGPLICGEALNGQQARQSVEMGARLLVAIANDAWFGISAAPHQHFALSTLRAIETRRDLVRVSNTGISGIVDATGRTRVRTELTSASGDRGPTVVEARVRLLDLEGPWSYSQRAFPWIAGLVLLVLARRR